MLALLPLLVMQADPTPEWPDPESESKEEPRLFVPDEPEDDYERDLVLEAAIERQLTGEIVYRWSWYGWRNIIPDVVAVGLAVATIPAENINLGLAGGAVYGLGSPIAHLTKGNWGRALLSFGLRAVAPGLVAALFFGGICAIERGDCSEIAGIGAAAGGVVGIAAAMGIDYGVLAREKVPVEPGE